MIIRCRNCNTRLCDVNEQGYFEFKTTEHQFRTWHIVFDRATFQCPFCKSVYYLQSKFPLLLEEVKIKYLELEG